MTPSLKMDGERGVEAMMTNHARSFLDALMFQIDNILLIYWYNPVTLLITGHDSIMLHFVSSTRHQDIVQALQKLAPSGAHFTNGTYAYDASLIVPTTLAGFRHICDQNTPKPLVVAVNSDESMRALEKTDFESQEERALKVAKPLSLLFPKQDIIVVYYDAKTPLELYWSLSQHNLTDTLHKWGYGTKPNEPKIEGAEFFKKVYGMPLPNDTKPVCYFDTEITDEPQSVLVSDLRGKYISADNQLLFSTPPELQRYAAPSKKHQAFFSTVQDSPLEQERSTSWLLRSIVTVSVIVGGLALLYQELKGENQAQPSFEGEHFQI